MVASHHAAVIDQEANSGGRASSRAEEKEARMKF